MEKTLLQILNGILSILKADGVGEVDTCFDPEIHLDLIEEETQLLEQRMGLTPMQSVLFAVSILKSSRGSMPLAGIGKVLGLNYLEILAYSSDINALRDKGLISLNKRGEIDVPDTVICSLMENRNFERKVATNLSTKSLMLNIRHLVRKRKSDDISSQKCLDDVEALIDNNPQTSFSKTYRRYIRPDEIEAIERLAFIVMIHIMYAGDDCVEVDELESYYDVFSDFINVSERLESESFKLLQDGVIEHHCEDGMVNPKLFHVKEDVLNELFADLGGFGHDATIALIDCNNKPTKQMYYNSKEREQIERLTNLLDPERFDNVIEAMDRKGLRAGFTCLFYGSPGTGKTETVYQIAKKTGRKILEADVARLKSMYVGESEKGLRRLFHSYRIALKENDLAPILLFNEADAILGKRMNGAVKAVDKMENSIQNILLQEMESFRGIMIATTNLTGNLDAAFERRFLYKVCFNKPDLSARTHIWQSMLTDISSDEAERLAANFDFSGGQIENVVRKKEIDAILNGVEPDYAALCDYCREESLVKGGNRNRIGFM